MDTIYYTKRFTSGLLNGISVYGKLAFDPIRMAEVVKRIHTGARGRDIFTKDRWVIVDASFQNYVR